MFYESDTIELKERYTQTLTRELVSFLNIPSIVTGNLESILYT